MSFTGGKQRATPTSSSHYEAITTLREELVADDPAPSLPPPTVRVPEFRASNALAAAVPSSEASIAPQIRKSERIQAMRRVKGKSTSHDRSVHRE